MFDADRFANEPVKILLVENVGKDDRKTNLKSATLSAIRETGETARAYSPDVVSKMASRTLQLQIFFRTAS